MQGLGYNAYLDGHGFFKDAIRTHWRLALDALWFDVRILERLSVCMCVDALWFDVRI